MPLIRFLLRLIDFASELTGKIVSFLMTFAIGIIVYGVVRRYFLHNPWRFETIATNFLTTYLLLGAAYALRSGAFVSIDIFHRRLPLRTRAIVNIGTSILFFLFLLALMKTAWTYAAFAKLSLSMRLLAPNRWPVRIAYPIGIGLLLLQGTAGFVRNLITAITGKELP